MNYRCWNEKDTVQISVNWKLINYSIFNSLRRLNFQLETINWVSLFPSLFMKNYDRKQSTKENRSWCDVSNGISGRDISWRLFWSIGERFLWNIVSSRIGLIIVMWVIVYWIIFVSTQLLNHFRLLPNPAIKQSNIPNPIFLFNLSVFVHMYTSTSVKSNIFPWYDLLMESDNVLRIDKGKRKIYGRIVGRSWVDGVKEWTSTKGKKCLFR